MEAVRYIHVSGLRLDAVFQGLRRATGNRLSSLMAESAFVALERLVRLCDAERPDFLVLAGDILNRPDHSLKARSRLNDAFEQLFQIGIPVFWAPDSNDGRKYGGHDPCWPKNVTVFSSPHESHEVSRNGELLAIVHGASRASGHDEPDPVRHFQRGAHENSFQLGVLPCPSGLSVEGNCVSCSVDALAATGLDAWALGMPAREILCGQPFIASPGCAQGLNANESGQGGCLLVSAEKSGGLWRCKADFRPLGPIVRETLQLDVSGSEALGDVENSVCEALEALRQKLQPECSACIVNFRLAGHTPLDAALRRPGAGEDFLERFFYLSSRDPVIWINELEPDTRAVREPREDLARDDLLGGIMRLAEDLQKDGSKLADFAQKAFRPLDGQGSLLRALPRLNESDLTHILADAGRICKELLEED